MSFTLVKPRRLNKNSVSSKDFMPTSNELLITERRKIFTLLQFSGLNKYSINPVNFMDHKRNSPKTKIIKKSIDSKNESMIPVAL
jgi:hypothetical protein